MALIDKGADTGAKSHDGDTALHHAYQVRCPEILMALMNRGRMSMQRTIMAALIYTMHVLSKLAL
jgi:hypothetical protein